MTTVTPKKTTASDAFRILLDQMSKRGSEATNKVNSMVQSRYGMDLEQFEETGGTEEERLAFYREALTSIMRPDELAKAAALKGKSAEDLFRELCELIRQKGREAHLKVTAHLRAATGEKSAALAVYHNGKAPEAEKVAIYVECIVALRGGDFSRLKGSVGAGDKRVEPVEAEEAAQEVSAPEPQASMRHNNNATLETVSPVVNTQSEPELETESDNDPVAAAMKLLQAATRKPKVDENIIRRIAMDTVAEAFRRSPVPGEADIRRIIHEAMGNGGFPTERVQSVIDDRLKTFTPKLDVDELLERKVSELMAGTLKDFLARGPAALSTKPEAAEDGALASSVPKPDPTYVVSLEMGAFLKHIHHLACKAPINVMVVGPHGCGKTTLAEIFAADFNMPLLIMDCANIREPRDWFGFKYTEGGTVKWHRSQFDRCLSAGNHVIVLDELPRSTDAIRNTLFPLLDYRRRTWLEERGDFITVGPATVFFVTANEGLAYTGCSTLDLALEDRLTRRVEVSYLTVADETEVLVKRTGIDRIAARRLAELADEIRRKTVGLGAVLTKPLSTRRLIEAAEDYKVLGVDGLTYSIANSYTAEGGDQSERAKVLLLIQGKFPR